ncbi:MAG: hypothetical protein KKD69_03160 [Euryarchaeota archaeon]|nr:hypothetical protein [Euryarchaeota archaeon]MBU4491441.1 hypothetical protein [Euryarchaeota archaeon]MCG2727584.1 hypothetical protein [Candidatus Methanoperedenaceae archaeon]
MNSAIHGVRRIAHEFNTNMQVLGKIIHIGKSRVHEILASAGIYKQNKIIKNKPKHLKRPEKSGEIVVKNLEHLRNNTKFGYNNRPNSSFSYKSPFDMMNEAIINSPQHVCGH